MTEPSKAKTSAAKRELTVEDPAVTLKRPKPEQTAKKFSGKSYNASTTKALEDITGLVYNE